MTHEEFLDFKGRGWHKEGIEDPKLRRFDNYNKLVKDKIDSLKNELQEVILKQEESQRNLGDFLRKDEVATDDELEDLTHIIQFDHWKYWVEQQLIVLNETQIIYLFKSLEISLKAIIQKAYPKASAKDLYQWENMLSFFKNKGISLSTLDGYQEIVELRKINNNIKHSHEIGDDILKIKEFKRGYTSVALEEFHKKVFPNLERFVESLSSAIVNDLYFFNDERLSNIAREHFVRMGVETTKTFIQKLKSTIKEYKKYPGHY